MRPRENLVGPVRELEAIREPLIAARAEIESAYWLFSRTLSPNVPPPSMQVPDSYRDRRLLIHELRAAIHRQNP